MSKVAVVIGGVFLWSFGSAQQVTTSGLLKQMYDLEWLTQRPSPNFKAAQASSYDRASTSPADEKTWFANGDAGQYLGTTMRDGMKEYIMADLKGPGTVVRIWSANPAGVLHFYFDGETTPRFNAKTEDILNGRFDPFGFPFSYPTKTASNGANLYFPFPYAKSLKITVDSSGGDGAAHMYYHVNYRSYTAGTTVETFQPSMLPGLKPAMDVVRSSLATTPSTAGTIPATVKSGRQIGQSATMMLNSKTGGEVKAITVKIPFPLVQTFRKMDWTDAYQPHNVLRNSTIKIVCDGEVCVNVPLGDFFATVPGPNDMHSYPVTVTKDGTMTCYWPMPYKKKMEITVQPPKGLGVPVELTVNYDNRPFTDTSYYFHAHWNADIGSTRPMRDMEFLNATGEGLWVGTHLHVTNPVGDWWGEGDEKVWVDGESFPSTFGTGSEDYFGYAWSSGNLFDRPYHGQAHCDGPGTYGHVSVHRWQTFDPISFSKSLKFDMEMWHWKECDARYARMSYWYAKPGSTSVEKPFKPKDLELVELIGPAPVKGAIEGESLKFEKTGGNTENQEGFFELSSGKQLWWTDPKEGDKITFRVPVKQTGRYEVFGNFCHAGDYGIHSLRFLTKDGKPLGDAKVLDFWGKGVSWKKISLGTFGLPEGEVLLEVVCKGHRADAVPRNMFGLDYLLLNRK